MVDIRLGGIYENAMGVKVGPLEKGEQFSCGPWYFKYAGIYYDEHGNATVKGPERLDGMKLVSEWPSGPIRETTIIKREIVFGVHGRIDLSPVEPGTEPEYGGVCIRLVNREGRMHDGGSDPALMTPDELDAAASVLTQIATVLRENQ